MDRKLSYQPLKDAPDVENVDSNSEHPIQEDMRDDEPTIDQCGTLDPYDYLGSVHSGLSTADFQHEEDFIDILFQKIESLACEMDGKPETILRLYSMKSLNSLKMSFVERLIDDTLLLAEFLLNSSWKRSIRLPLSCQRKRQFRSERTTRIYLIRSAEAKDLNQLGARN